MAAKKKNVGTLIKEARTEAGLSQTALAAKVEGVSASDIGKAERGEKDLPQASLKLIAKALGITQKSLLEAPKGGTETSSAKKPASSSTSAKKPASSSSSSAKKPASSSSSSGKKTESKKSDTLTLTATEKKLVEAYRKADSETKKAAMSLLKGEKSSDLTSVLLSNAAGSLGGLFDILGKREMPEEEE